MRSFGVFYDACPNNLPNSKVHGANMGPTWVLSAQIGPMLAPWTLLSGLLKTPWCSTSCLGVIWLVLRGPYWCYHATCNIHDDVIKWKHFPRNWPFVRGIHRSPVNSTHKGQWRGALMFSLICGRINGWVNNGEAGDLRRYRVHCDVMVMLWYIGRRY